MPQEALQTIRNNHGSHLTLLLRLLQQAREAKKNSGGGQERPPRPPTSSWGWTRAPTSGSSPGCGYGGTVR